MFLAIFQISWAVINAKMPQDCHNLVSLSLKSIDQLVWPTQVKLKESARVGTALSYCLRVFTRAQPMRAKPRLSKAKIVVRPSRICTALNFLFWFQGRMRMGPNMSLLIASRRICFLKGSLSKEMGVICVWVHQSQLMSWQAFQMGKNRCSSILSWPRSTCVDIRRKP